MTHAEVIAFLREFNRWRRGGHDQQPPRAHEVGEAIDAACDHIEQLEIQRDEARGDYERVCWALAAAKADQWRNCAAGLASALHQMRDIPDYAEFALTQFERLKETSK
jgi:hypothetical protein